ncbi:alginate lyase family protein [Mycobacterium sp. SMC-4]|uniref:heparinase II/III family protein n=1 Tax=Mycobacterium sp. SMC-4 TaxID=2857059 RepID=UPI0021B356C0|nr:alginate lyase family protein [Mycobacterium sp. SMC-4]UXA19285.1 heparinase II/III family protein [Mycobacterium sp. SMC-4]
MHDLWWLYRRLRVMQAREVIWRLKQTTRNRIPVVARTSTTGALESRYHNWTDALASFRDCRNRPILLDRERAQLISQRHEDLVAEVVNAANRTADFVFWFPGYPQVSAGRPIDWNHDPTTDIRYPTLPSNRINYRTLPGDIAWIWRVNRLQHLVWLAEAWLFTGDDRYSQAAFEHLDTWIDQNPPGRGVAWCGSFEASLRAVSISIALQGLRDAPQLTVERFGRIVGVLAQTARRCWVDRSLFSSANNHLIGEMAGLATVAIMFPELRGSKRWERQAVGVLSDEATKQVLSDGVGAEQSVSYQMFTVELLHLVTVLLIQRDGSAPATLVRAVARSSSFLSALITEGEPAPRFGDDDEGFALRFGAQPARNLEDHVGMMAASGFTPAGFTAGSESVDSLWFGLAAATTPWSIATEGSGEQAPAYGSSFVAPEGGFVVLRSRNCRATMDIGPLGYLSTAAHGHSDALAVTLTADGKDLISDPGTGSYYGHPGWRGVARGTRAHATVCIDEQDQSVIGGPYLWLQHARVQTLGVNLDAGIVDAQHDGYARLPGSVMHRRWLVASPDEDTQLVIDLITGNGQHSCEQNWPLHPSLTAVPTDDGHLLLRDGSQVARLHHAATLPLRIMAERGSEETNRGWWSNQEEGRSPAWWISSHCSGELPVVMATLISPANEIAINALSVRLSARTITVGWTEYGRDRSAEVDIDAAAAVLLKDATRETGPT